MPWDDGDDEAFLVGVAIFIGEEVVVILDLTLLNKWISSRVLDTEEEEEREEEDEVIECGDECEDDCCILEELEFNKLELKSAAAAPVASINVIESGYEAAWDCLNQLERGIEWGLYRY